MRRLRRDEVHARLLAAAARVFAEKGIEAATVDDVAAAAGFTRGAVYSNFSGKEGLLTALLAERIADKVTESLTLLDSAPTDEDFPARAGRLLAGHIREDRDGHQLVLEILTYVARNERMRTMFVA